MKIREIELHNDRSIRDAKFYVADYGLLIGANNSGKTSVLDALRNFYEKDIKFDQQRDFPKFPTDDKESWLEIEYELSKDEADSIKAEYRQAGNRFRVRKVLHSDDKAKLHLYAYEGGALSQNQFYGDDTGRGPLTTAEADGQDAVPKSLRPASLRRSLRSRNHDHITSGIGVRKASPSIIFPFVAIPPRYLSPPASHARIGRGHRRGR